MNIPLRHSIKTLIQFGVISQLMLLILFSGQLMAGSNLEDIARKFKDPTSFYLLGERLTKGRGIEKNYAKALIWYEEAAKLGHIRSQLRLGKMYYHGIGIKPNYAKALQWLKKPALDGSSAAQYLLGLMYLNGKGTKNDMSKAIHYLQQAAGGSHADAAYQLGRIYFKGIGVEKDLSKAKDYLGLDQVKGLREAALMLERINAMEQPAPTDDSRNIIKLAKAKPETVKPAPVKQKRIIEKPKLPLVVPDLEEFKEPILVKTPKQKMLESAESGDAVAQYDLGLAYLHGDQYFKADRNKARYWLKKSASQQYSVAQFELGMMDYNPESSDDYRGIKWLRLAAEQGHAEAQYFLGSLYSGRQQFSLAKKWLSSAIQNGNNEALDLAIELYFSGKMLTLDKKTKITWLSLASHKGLNQAQFRLGELYLADPSEQAQAKARFWLEKAASKGHVMAQFRIGQMFMQGIGVSKRYSQSAVWMRKAAEQGHKDAQFQLAELYRQGLGLPKSKTKAAKWYKRAAEQGHREAKLILGRRQVF